MEIWRKYGVGAIVSVPLIAAGAQNFQVNPTLAAGDCKLSKDGGAFANTATPTVTPAGGRKVQVVLTAANMQAKRIVVQFVDVAGAEWEDNEIQIITYGHDSALMDFNLGDGAAGKIVVALDGKSVQIKDADDNTMLTLTRSASAPYEWTPS